MLLDGLDKLRIYEIYIYICIYIYIYVCVCVCVSFLLIYFHFPVLEETDKLIITHRVQYIYIYIYCLSQPGFDPSYGKILSSHTDEF